MNNKSSNYRTNNKYKKSKRKKGIIKISCLPVLIVIIILLGYRYITTGSLDLKKINYSSLDKFIESFFGLEDEEKQYIQPKKITDEKLEYARFNKEEIYIPHSYYTIGYNKDTLQANWVGYYLTRTRLIDTNSSRTDDFREDENCPLPRATLDDYRRSGYDRGHLAPAADFKFDKLAMSETFYLSNMSPQKHNFNAGIWEKAESIVRQNAYEWGDLYVTTGPYFDNTKSHETIGKNLIAVPDAYYKALLVYNDTYKKAIAFLIPHTDEKQNGNISKYAMSVDELEAITGIDFFYNLEDKDEVALEKNYDLSLWTLREYQR